MNTLICTLGTAAPIITETLVSLKKEKKIEMDTLHIIHTSSPEVYYKKIKEKEVGLIALKDFLKENYPKLKLKLHKLRTNDINTVEDNDALLNLIVNIISREKKSNNKVYVSIAGGRKTMSAIALFASYLSGCNGIYHVLVKGNEFDLTAEYGFKIPPKLLTLISLPQINLSTILESVINDTFKNEKTFYNDADISLMLDNLNSKLLSNINVRKLKEEYEKLQPKYSLMCNAVESILISRSGSINIMRPIFEKRVKTLESIVNKMINKGEKNEFVVDPFSRFKDIAGVRVICYFAEDAKNICNIIKECKDFNIIQPKIKSEAYGYNAKHFIVTLKGNRTRLIEYRKLKDIKCEIQVKTIFSHAWSQLDHRLVYKSEEYKSFDDKTKNFIEKVFTAGNSQLKSAEQEFNKIKKYYSII